MGMLTPQMILGLGLVLFGVELHAHSRIVQWMVPSAVAARATDQPTDPRTPIVPHVPGKTWRDTIRDLIPFRQHHADAIVEAVKKAVDPEQYEETLRDLNKQRERADRLAGELLDAQAECHRLAGLAVKAGDQSGFVPYDEAYSRYKAGEVAVVIIGGDWCGPCNALAAELEPAVRHRWPAGVALTKLDTTKAADQATIATLHKGGAVPQTHIYPGNAVIVGRNLPAVLREIEKARR